MSITTSISDAGPLLHIHGSSAQSLFHATANCHEATVFCWRHADDIEDLSFETDDAGYKLRRVGDDYTLTIRLLDTK